MRAWVLVLMLLTVPLVGCVGTDDGGSTGGDGDDPVKNRAKATDTTGVIAGVVTDSAVQPVPGANVTVVELNETVRTTSDGSFSIGPLEPGTYTLTARAGGFLSAQQPVTVEAGERSSVDFILTRLQSEQAFTQQFEVAGFFEYGWGLGFNVSGTGTWVRDSNCDYDPIAGPLCRGNFDFEPPLEDVVFEMDWDPATPLAGKLYAMMRVRDNASIITGEWGFFSIEGEAPLYYHMPRSEIDAVMANFTERCENGEDQFCSLNFRDRGWPMQTRVWPSWQCPNEQGAFCAVAQQEYTQYITAFYHTPAPEGYSIVQGTAGGGFETASPSNPTVAAPTAIPSGVAVAAANG